jgi:predicted RecA/RadA family phage recombinase
MKKLIAFSSVLALVLASSGLFAIDILDKEGEATGFSVSSTAQFGFDIWTPSPNAGTAYDPEPTVIYQINSDPHAKVEIGVSYDKDNYAFGLAARWRKNYVADGATVELDNAWGKYYLMDKKLWLRAGGLGGDWNFWDTFAGAWGDDKQGFQVAFVPGNGLNVGLSLPVPKEGTRQIKEGKSNYWSDDSTPVWTQGYGAKMGNWGPTYPFANMVFGLRLNGTIPNLDLATELKLNGLESTNGKYGTADEEGEGEFLGMDFQFQAKYTFAPVTLQATLLATGIANGIKDAPDPMTQAAVQVTFDIPNSVPNLDLGDPWVRLKMVPNELANSDGAKGVDAFADMLIDFEWEPNYSIVPDKVKALLFFGVYYRSWANAETDDLQKKYPLEFSVRPKVEFKFAPSATLTIFDQAWFAQKAVEKGFKNEIGFRFAWAF